MAFGPVWWFPIFHRYPNQPEFHMHLFIVLVEDLIRHSIKTIEIAAHDAHHVDQICGARGLLALSIELA
jgi:hypothetical protein